MHTISDSSPDRMLSQTRPRPLRAEGRLVSNVHIETRDNGVNMSVVRSAYFLLHHRPIPTFEVGTFSSEKYRPLCAALFRRGIIFADSPPLLSPFSRGIVVELFDE